jgi:thiol:disulfide interchange protein
MRVKAESGKWLLVLITLASLCCQAQWKKTPLQRPSWINPNLYRADADANKEIREAKLAAAKSKKRILLVFGANWCLDCHVLERAFHQPRVAPLLESNFLVVHVDVGEYTKNLDLAKRYNVNLSKGVPSIAVLSAQGALLNSTSEFEKARSLNEEDVIDFLNKWKPPSAGH